MSTKALTVAASYYHWLATVPFMGSAASILNANNLQRKRREMDVRHNMLGLPTARWVTEQ
eukprot:6251898-Ditylum_brightwellii.AAC.1